MTKYLIIFSVTVLGVFAFPNLQPETLYNGRIVGGMDAPPGRFPYMVSLQRNKTIPYCGGSILNRRTVITAAHCIDGAPTSYINVVAGITKLSEAGDRHTVSKLIPHPSSDVGLVILEDPIQFSKNVQPIEWEEEWNDENREAVACGWGSTGASAPGAEHLQYINTIALSNAECQAHGSSVNNSVICTLTKAGEGICFNDSGSPLISNGKLIGCVSSGIPCALGYPDIFGRVSHVSGWIKENLVDD